MSKPPIVIAHDFKTHRPEDVPDEFLDALEAEIARNPVTPIGAENRRRGQHGTGRSVPNRVDTRRTGGLDERTVWRLMILVLAPRILI
jgi:hypothetical protein